MNRLALLTREHDRQGFDCGSQPLNHYLRAIARQHGEKGISKTYVLVSDEETTVTPKPVLAYFALTIREVESPALPDKFAQVPRHSTRFATRLISRQPGPAEQGNWCKVLSLTLDTLQTVGGVGLFVDAKDENALRFYQRYPFHQLPDQPFKLFMPIATINELLTS